MSKHVTQQFGSVFTSSLSEIIAQTGKALIDGTADPAANFGSGDLATAKVLLVPRDLDNNLLGVVLEVKIELAMTEQSEADLLAIEAEIAEAEIDQKANAPSSSAKN